MAAPLTYGDPCPSFNIPTLVGVDIDALTPWQHQTIYIDGNAGAIVVEPGESVARYYQQEARVQDALREQQRVWLTQQARTADGIRIEIAANIAHSVEAQACIRQWCGRRWFVPH